MADQIAHLPVAGARRLGPVVRVVNDVVEPAALGAYHVENGGFAAVVHRVDGHGKPPVLRARARCLDERGNSDGQPRTWDCDRANVRLREIPGKYHQMPPAMRLGNRAATSSPRARRNRITPGIRASYTRSLSYADVHTARRADDRLPRRAQQRLDPRHIRDRPGIAVDGAALERQSRQSRQIALGHADLAQPP